jgi:hypothetical protein
MFALRKTGTNDFVSQIPHDYMPENFVPGWDKLTENGALTYVSFEDAFTARLSDPDGESLQIEDLSQ